MPRNPKGITIARKVEVKLVDDIDGSPADTTVAFAFDGVKYEIDLTETHRAEFADAIAPYVEHARKVATRGRTAAAPAASSGVTPADIRRWAEVEGIEVSPRGRIPAKVIAMYEAAH